MPCHLFAPRTHPPAQPSIHPPTHLPTRPSNHLTPPPSHTHTPHPTLPHPHSLVQHVLEEHGKIEQDLLEALKLRHVS